MAAWLLLTLFISVHNQLSSTHSTITYQKVQMFEKEIHQIDSQNDWLLLSAGFTVKFGLVFV